MRAGPSPSSSGRTASVPRPPIREQSRTGFRGVGSHAAEGEAVLVCQRKRLYADSSRENTAREDALVQKCDGLLNGGKSVRTWSRILGAFEGETSLPAERVVRVLVQVVAWRG